MAEIQCPICHRTNDTSAERCWFCQAVLPHKAEPSAEAGDWLDGLRGDSGPRENAADNEPAANQPEPPAEEVPEWLARIRELEHQNLGNNTEPENPNPASESQNSDDQNVSKDHEESSATGAAQSANTEDADDWLKSLQNWQPPSTESPESESPEKTSPSQSQDEAPMPSAEVEPTANEEVDDRFSSLIADNEAALPIHEPAETSAPTEASPFSEKPDEEVDSSKPTFEPFSDEPAVPQPEPEPGQAEQSDNWLSSFRGLTPEKDLNEQVFPQAEEAAPNKNPFSGDPDQWIEEPSSGHKPEATGEPVSKGKLEPASLPVWIQALSPNQKGKSGTASSHTETSGPLAGIEGTLAGEDPSKYYSGSQTFSGSLKVTESQLSRAQILKNISEQAHWEDDEKSTQKSSYRWVVRLVVTLAILVGVFLPMLLQSLPVIAPTLYPDEVVQFYNTVSSLNSAHPVLVAADFDGSLYGELKWTMQPVLQQLVSQQVPLAYLSTNSEGAVLLQNSLSQSSLPDTIPAINLGYLAGGSIGLQTLARDPRTAFPLDANLNNVWNDLPMSQVKQLSDFGAVIVITENADTARYWIEQVQPVLGNVPMLVIIAAQSAPLLQPYYDSGQINGYLSGLSSAVVFETLQKAPSQATRHLGSVQYTSLIVTALIIIGGIISLILYKPAEQRSKE
jgi:hypothetical protein